MIAAVAPLGPLDLFGEGSAFVTVLLVVGLVGAVALWLLRKGVSNQGVKDVLGVSASFLVLVFVAVLMMVVEHAGG